MKNLIKTKWFIYGTYLLLVMAALLIGFVLLQNNNTLKNVIVSFFEVAENRTFDYRQALQVIHKRPLPNKDIVVLAVDDASLEMLWDKYGEWPMPRNVYADMINYLEKQKPQQIIFDLMFIKSIRTTGDADKYLADTMNKYPNIYTAMSFDDQPTDVRIPIDLPERLAINLENKSNVNFNNKYKFLNCRPILNSLIDGRVNIGMTNVIRNSDGIIRYIAPLMVYKDKFYPYLTFKAGADYLLQKPDNDFTIDKNSNLQLFGSRIPLTKDGEAILNWYGPSGTHTIVPMYKLIREMDGGVKCGFNFRDKIIIIGTTAMSLHDTKSVPVQESVYPGVEVHATFFNNMLDNNFIQKTGLITDILILAGVIAIVGGIVMLSTSTLFAFLSTSLFAIAYLSKIHPNPLYFQNNAVPCQPAAVPAYLSSPDKRLPQCLSNCRQAAGLSQYAGPEKSPPARPFFPKQRLCARNKAFYPTSRLPASSPQAAPNNCRQSRYTALPAA